MMIACKRFFARILLKFFFFSFLSVVALTAHAQDIIVWHSLDGALGEKFSAIVHNFNQKPESIRENIRVVPQFKGTYEEAMAVGLKALGTSNKPHILQLYEMGNLVMQANPSVYVPLNKLSNQASPSFERDHFVPALFDFYKGRHADKGLQSLPFSASTAILFYNKDAFRKAGLDPEFPPITWEAFENMAATLKLNGAKTVLVSGWLSGHQIDQMGARHNQPVASKGNGLDGDGAVLMVNSAFFNFHLGKLADWYKQGFFSLDSGAKAEEAFGKGEAVMLTMGANRLPVIERLVNGKFEIGVSTFPYWQEKIENPENTIAGGASFWALAGHNVKDYAAIQKFFEYLVHPDTQATWHQETGYMPVVVDAFKIAEKNHFYEQGLKGKAAKIAINSFMGQTPKDYSRGILLPNFPKVRDLMIQEMKEAIKGNKSPAEALDQMVILGNKSLQEGTKF